ncbi:DUF72 domain-containing protein [Sphaerisporangium sp. NPDC088356]|uniref:DUF72 domain-containing protein n=1 Tax=Sphaerisporangium sp. NPDC088356 TaxID=3154871 RepID=UPI00341F9175
MVVGAQGIGGRFQHRVEHVGGLRVPILGEQFVGPGLPQRVWLERYAECFDTVENNNAFYRLPPRETFESWRERTPDGFVMAVKASRFLTHIKRLKEPEEPVQRLIRTVPYMPISNALQDLVMLSG